MKTLKLKAVHPDLLGEIKNAVIAHRMIMAEKKTNFIFRNSTKRQVTGHLNLPAFPGPVIVKAFKINKCKASIPHCIYPDPAIKSYDTALKVRHLGPITPDIFGYASDRRFFKSGMRYLVMTWMLGWTRFEKNFASVFAM